MSPTARSMLIARILSISGFALLTGVLKPALAAEEIRTVRLPQLGGSVEVIFDAYAIPHIYASSIEDAYRALGYIHATDRFMEMEMMRRTASGTLSEVVGEEEFEADALVRRLGIRKSSEEVWKSGMLGPDVEHGLAAYAEGVNARLDEMGKDHLPPLLKFLGVKVAPWTPVDTLSFMKYMGWDQSGTDSDLWMGMMVEKLGAETVDELWPIDRPYEVPIVPQWRTEPAQGSSPGSPSASVRSGGPSDDMLALAAMGPKGFGQKNYLGLMDRLLAAAQGPLASPEGSPFGSNNWVISGKKSTTGKPILANDPHLGFKIPSIWYTAHIVAPGLNVTGVTFPCGPFVVIGHNDRIAWGLTNMQADAVDYFIETINPDNPREYKHKGEWKKFQERKEVIAIRGKEPREVIVQSTIHGPIEKVGDRAMALQWTGLGPTLDARAISELNRMKGLKDFQAALKFMQVPAMNMIYADVEGNIAIAPHGDLPLRGRGKGRVPVDGASGEYDWMGYIPVDQLPISINPERGYLASANGRPSPLGYPNYLGWMWDPSYRTRRINDLLASKEKVSFEDMQRFQYDTHDKAAEVFVPVLVKVIEGAFPKDESARAALEALKSWDYVCTPDKIAPTIFARWFNLYRSMVWDDEWKSRGIEQPQGGWGFTGDNRREPELEVLEYITRENPDSIWFDDRMTPEREGRDDILKKSFEKACSDLASTVGRDTKLWAWGNFNKLRVPPQIPAPQMERGGIPIPGGPFTLNPGSDGGLVDGGASWRQVVDLGNLARSVGVYPGGQSDDPKSPHYDDQIALWARGEYAPLTFSTQASEFKPENVKGRMRFSPN